MKKKLLIILGAYLVGALISFYFFDNMWIPGPSREQAMLMAALWPVTWIYNLFS